MCYPIIDRILRLLPSGALTGAHNEITRLRCLALTRTRLGVATALVEGLSPAVALFTSLFTSPNAAATSLAVDGFGGSGVVFLAFGVAAIVQILTPYSPPFSARVSGFSGLAMAMAKQAPQRPRVAPLELKLWWYVHSLRISRWLRYMYWPT